MREIKFRVWDKKNKKWIDDSDIAINQKGLLFVRYEGQVEFQPMSLTKSSNFKVVLYTGINDKKGKEIYQGDVVEIKSIDGIYYEKICWNKSESRLEDNCWEFSDSTGWFVEELEIIGSIYENPELLTQMNEKRNTIDKQSVGRKF